MSMLMVLHAAVAVLLHRLGAGDDIVVGTPVAGRDEAALNDVIGFFVNTVVLRADVSGNPSFDELLTRVRAADLAAFAHQELPFERLVEALNPPRIAGRNPLFNVFIGYHRGDGDDAEMFGLPTHVARNDRHHFDVRPRIHADRRGSRRAVDAAGRVQLPICSTSRRWRP